MIEREGKREGGRERETVCVMSVIIINKKYKR